MGERKGTNKYYPPDFDPAKHKSLNGYHGVHPLRERARKLNKGILIIRFELPYNIWCGGCNKHVGMGVRYNAEKTKVGSYYTTPIYRFRMKCHLCDNHFEIETDPKNMEYVIVSGARRKNEKWDPEENEQVAPEDRETTKKLATDPMYKLEHGVEDRKKSEIIIPTLSELEEVQSEWKDDYMMNKMLRSKFRHEKVDLNKAAEQDQALLKKSSLDIELVPENEQDVKLAALMKYRTVRSFEDKKRDKRKEILNKPLFESTASPKDQKLVNAKKRLGLDKKHNVSSAMWDLTPGKKNSPVTSTGNLGFGIVRKKCTTTVVNRNEVDSEKQTQTQETTPSLDQNFGSTDNSSAFSVDGQTCTSSAVLPQILKSERTSTVGDSNGNSDSSEIPKMLVSCDYGSSEESDPSL